MTWRAMTHDEKVAAIREGVAANKTGRMIGRELSATKSTITSFARHHNIPMLPLGLACSIGWSVSDHKNHKPYPEVKSLANYPSNIRSHVIDPGENPWAKA